MRIAILGAGGVGGYFGARLAAAGNDVVFVARGMHRSVMEKDGLRVTSDAGDLHIAKPRVFEDPAQTDPCDIILFCVKLWDTESAAALIRPLLNRDTAVISLQNGVVAEQTLARVLGAEFVLGGVAQIASSIVRPGVIRHVGTLARLVFGELDGQPSPRQEAFLQTCRAAGIKASSSADISTDIWKKFVLLASLAGATCLYRCPVGELLSMGDRCELLERLLNEAVAVGRAKGAALAPDIEDRVTQAIKSLPPQMKPSMLHDLEAGRRLELEWLNGVLVRLGAEAGVPVPENARVTKALMPYAMGGV